jgi:hypothetical protein
MPLARVPRPPRCTIDFELGHRAIDRLVSDYLKRHGRWRAEAERETGLLRKLEQAIAVDSERFAEQLDTGDEPEPERKATIAAEKELDANRRRSDALARRLHHDHAKLVAAIASASERIRVKALKAEHRAAVGLIDRLERLAADDLAELHRARRVVDQVEWLGEVDPEQALELPPAAGMMMAVPPPAGPGSVMLDGRRIPGRCPDVQLIDSLVAALREVADLAEQPEPEPEPELEPVAQAG